MTSSYSRPWSPEQTLDLHRYYNMGLHDEEIGKEIGRTALAVMHKRYAERLFPKADRKQARWLPAEDDLIRKMVADGCSDIGIAEKLSRTPSSVENRRFLLRVSVRRPNNMLPPACKICGNAVSRREATTCRECYLEYNPAALKKSRQQRLGSAVASVPEFIRAPIPQHKTLSAALCGDPLPGRSALDKKMAAGK